MGSTDEFEKFNILLTDENFINNLEIPLIAGRNLSAAGQSSDRFILINESAVRKLGYKDASEIIGKTFEADWNRGIVEVIGVVKDFRFRGPSETDAISPLMLRNQPGGFSYVNIKIASRDLIGTVTDLGKKWKTIDPVHPFKYEFFDDQLAATHQVIFDIVSILGFIAFLAIVIACLGLLGMATYTAERRRKEVGIRKVLGAADVTIALLLSKSFLKMLIVSVCIGAPLSYLINNLWLQKFPNRVDFGLGTVLLATFILLVLGLITIGSQTIRASKTNPVDTLKMD
jgi:putative ABC transport system permease protein